MDSLLDSIEPQPNNWFETTVKYEGDGTAVFTYPPITAFGPCTATFTDNGDYLVDMVVLRTELTSQNEEDQQWTSVKRAHQFADIHQLECNSFNLQTEHGDLFTDDPIIVNPTIAFDKGYVELSFRFRRSRYTAVTENRACYWIMPLANFISDFMDRVPELDRHPLRIYPTPEIPSNISEDQTWLAESKANEFNQLIAINNNGKLGFIERLSDYTERIEQLEKGTARVTATAIIVGTMADANVEFDSYETWQVYHLPSVLSLTTGTPVFAPWIEFRDEQGNIVERFHVRSERPVPYVKGSAALSEAHNRGTGQLISLAMDSPLFSESWFRVVLKLTVQAGIHHPYVEENLTAACKAIDCIASRYGLSSESKTESLSEEYTDRIRVILQSARTAIEEMKDELERGQS